MGDLREELSQWVKQGASLVGAESKLFVSSLLGIVALAVASAFVLAGALLFLVTAFVLSLIVHGGMDPALAALLAAFLLLAIVALCFFGMRRLARHLRFTESRRLLTRLAHINRSGESGETP